MMMERRGLLRFVRALEEIQDLERISTALVFFTALTRPGITLTELAEEYGIPASSVSRNLANLSDIDWRKMPGLELIRYDYDRAVSSREKQIMATSKGAILAAKVGRIICP